MFLSYGVAVVLFLIVESIRFELSQSEKSFARELNVALRRFTDSRDSGPLILTHIYLLLGCAFPTWLNDPWIGSYRHYLYFNALIPLCGVLMLGVGDTMASFIGVNCGRTKWPGTSKSVEGTLASIVFVSVLAYALVYFKALINSMRFQFAVRCYILRKSY